MSNGYGKDEPKDSLWSTWADAKFKKFWAEIAPEEKPHVVGKFFDSEQMAYGAQCICGWKCMTSIKQRRDMAVIMHEHADALRPITKNTDPEGDIWDA